MKVFLSWSGDTSHRVACVLREWLPSVIQAVRPYVSSEDIDKGARWSTDIALELEQASYGVICVTRENIEAPWITFEAGALSKSIDKVNVTPFLFRLKRSEVQGPLLQFQSVVYEKEDLGKLIRSLNNRLDERERLLEEQLQRAFEVWWPQLQKELDGIPDKAVTGKARTAESKERGEILEEILELVRIQQRLLSSPEILLPRDYLLSALSREGLEQPRRRTTPTRIHNEIIELMTLLESLPKDAEGKKRALIDLAGRIHGFYHLEEVPARKPSPVSRPAEGDEYDIPAVLRAAGKGKPGSDR